MTFGSMFTLFAMSEKKVQKNVARKYGIAGPVLYSWLQTLNYVLNICAHHARLWNRELAIRPTVPDVKNGPEWHRPQSIDTNRMFVVLTILRFLLHRVAPQRRAEVGLLLEQRGMDLGRRLIHEAIAVQHVEDRLSFTGCQGPRRGRPRRPRTWRAGGPLPPIERRARDADAGTQRRRLARGRYGRDCRHQSGSSLSSGFRGDRVVVSTGRPIRCPRSDDQEGEGARTATVEEGVWLPSASARGECVLPVQVDRRRLSSGTQFIGATA